MAWLESHQSLPQHPKTKRAARLLEIPIPLMIGHLHMLWYWCLDYAQDGDLGKYDDADIADAAGWEGEAARFVSALLDCAPRDEVGFLERDSDGILHIHDWYDYAGKLIEQREANAQRMREARAARKNKRASNVQRTSGARAGATIPNQPNQTRPNQPPPQTPPPPPPSPGHAPEATDKPSRGGEWQRPRNALFDAVMLVCGYALDAQLTKAEGKRIGAAVAEIGTAGGMPKEVPIRATRYRHKYPSAALTPNALSSHWGELATEEQRDGKRAEQGDGNGHGRFAAFVSNGAGGGARGAVQGEGGEADGGTGCGARTGATGPPGGVHR
jgi:hypothetical protein